jgi:hypothetical protein
VGAGWRRASQLHVSRWRVAETNGRESAGVDDKCRDDSDGSQRQSSRGSDRAQVNAAEGLRRAVSVAWAKERGGSRASG